MRLSGPQREALRVANAPRKNCGTCDKPFERNLFHPLTSLVLDEYWYCSPQCHPHFDDEKEYAKRFTIPGSLAYYKKTIGWWTEEEIAKGELADAVARDSRWEDHYKQKYGKIVHGSSYVNDTGSAFEDEEHNDPERYGFDPHE
jgi:hypothetical protein